MIDRLLLNPNTTRNMKNKIHYILFKYYDKWAFSKAYQFKQFHKHKCEHISTLELYNYASFGLYKSIKKYDYKYSIPFSYVADKYITYELLKGLTDLYPITSINKSIRRKGYNDTKKIKSSVQLVGNDEWIYDKVNKHKLEENYPLIETMEIGKFKNMWQKINELEPFQKRIMYLKFNFYLDKIRSNKEVSLLMGCSEEWIRQNIIKIVNIICNN
jgi:DNA-directed RNA polymerase specialized sigma subunit